jgi:hypothetical protein
LHAREYQKAVFFGDQYSIKQAGTASKCCRDVQDQITEIENVSNEIIRKTRALYGIMAFGR